MKQHIRQAFCGAVLIIITACTLADVKVEVVSQRTALENQVLGTYNSLDQEMLLVTSVRGVDSQGNIRKPPPHSQDHKDAIDAMQVQAFHADDIQSFKQLGWVGENNQGQLTPFEMIKTDTPEDLAAFAASYNAAEFKAVVEQVNAARTVVMQRVIEINENLTEDDLVNIQKLFGKLNAENALPGEKIQTEPGTWTTKQ